MQDRLQFLDVTSHEQILKTWPTVIWVDGLLEKWPKDSMEPFIARLQGCTEVSLLCGVGTQTDLKKYQTGKHLKCNGGQG